MKELLTVVKPDKIFIFAVFVFVIGAGVYVHSITSRFEAELDAFTRNQSQDMARIITATESVESDLRQLQYSNKQQNFELVISSMKKLRMLVRSVSDDHDYAPGTTKSIGLQLIQPLIQDVMRWLNEGIGSEPPNSATVRQIIGQRLYVARVSLENLQQKSSEQSLDLLTDLSIQQKSFGQTVILLLLGLAALLTAAALLYARNRQTQENLWHQRKLVTDSINNINEGFILTAPNGRARVVNNALSVMCAPLAESLKEGVPYYNALEHALLSGAMSRIDTRKLENSNDSASGAEQFEGFQALYRTQNGLYLRATERETGDGGKVVTLTDITDLKLVEDKLQYQANYDFLTGIANRSYYVERLNEALARARRHNHKVALLQFDLDKFKQVNDTLGHAVGDQLLVHTASRIKRNLREIDLAARTGGDEFVAIIDQIVDQKEAVVSAERIVAELYQELEINGVKIDFSTSIGIAVFPDHAEDADTLMQHADIACYQAKASGRNNFQLYGANMKEQAIGMMTLETNLRSAIDEDALFIDYQPYVDLKTRKLCGVEALSRWYDSKLGLVAPARFIPVAEKTGLISILGEQVLQKVFQQLSFWQESGMAKLQVAINLSQRQLFQPALAECVDRLSKEYKVDPSDILFEVNEAAITQDPELASQHLGRLAERNIRFVIDDYGKGNSSLHRIKNLPIEALKIDGGFTRRLQDDAATQDVVAAIISSASNLQLATIAECVENEEQIRLLEELGCTMIQGYYIGEPQSAERINENFKGQELEWMARKIA